MSKFLTKAATEAVGRGCEKETDGVIGKICDHGLEVGSAGTHCAGGC